MNMATKISRDLVSGQVICRESNPDGFNWLSDPDGLDSALHVLAPLGLRIVTTSSQAGFYAAEEDDDRAGQQLRNSADRLALESERIEGFRSFLLDVFPDAEPLRCGSEINASEILDAVNASNTLVESLTQLTASMNMTSNTTAKRVSNLLGNLAREGYLKCINQKTEQYRATARFDRAWDVCEYLVSMRPGAAEAVEAATRGDDGQGDLFS